MRKDAAEKCAYEWDRGKREKNEVAHPTRLNRQNKNKIETKLSLLDVDS